MPVFITGCGSNSFFARITGARLPDDATVILKKSDTTEIAYIWFCPRGVESFDVPSNLPFVKGCSEWKGAGFDEFGELKDGDFAPTMKFKIFRNSKMHVAIGKDIAKKQIALSVIDTD